MEQTYIFLYIRDRLYINDESAGQLSQLPGCCAVWHFHTLGLAAHRFPEKLVEWLEDTLKKKTAMGPAGTDRFRGMMLLTASRADGYGSLIKVLQARPKWEEKCFRNPQNGHKVSLFTLVREGKGGEGSDA